MMNAARDPRHAYLLGDRRVRVADLIEAGLLESGARLVFQRPRVGTRHLARVTQEGAIQLEDGRTFTSPSRAAVAATGGRALDGWNAWVLESTGQLLDELRQRLLDEVAKENESGAEHSSDERVQGLHARLKSARAEAEADRPVELTVRELLEYWGEDTRSSRATDRVETELANHGLVSVPDFRKVTLDAQVKLLPVRSLEELEPAPQGAMTSLADRDPLMERGVELDVGRTVGNLESALGGLVSVSPNASYDEAITKMLLNDFSQLAVTTGVRSLVGAVTWKSIAQARHANIGAPFQQAVVRAREVRFDQELIDVLGDLVTEDFLFVRNQRNEISGIITTADVVQEYGELATPFLLIGELDRLLRQSISQTFRISEVQAACSPDGRRSVDSFDQMSFGDYQRVLQNPANWQRLGWPLDRRVFDERLQELREIRNDIMHFNPDPVPADAISKLRAVIRLVRQYSD